MAALEPLWGGDPVRSLVAVGLRSRVLFMNDLSPVLNDWQYYVGAVASTAGPTS